MNNLQPVAPPYPLQALPAAVRNAANHLMQTIQTPDAMTCMEVLAAMSAACQGMVDVELPSGSRRPVSLNFLCIGKSGERKTALYLATFAAFFAHDKAAALKFSAALDQYEIDAALWESQTTGLRRRIAKLLETGESATQLQDELTAHLKAKPKQPRLRRLIRTNMTERAAMETLQGDGETLAFVTDEGEELLNSPLMRHFSLLNKAWDGAPMLTLDRADTDQLLVMNPRVTVGLMVQAEVLRAFMDKHGTVARGAGHWARYLVGAPASMQGHRDLRPFKGEPEHLQAFTDRIIEFLERYDAMLASGEIRREVVTFSADAAALWHERAQQVEWMMRPGDYFHDVNDFGSKVMEIIGRLAALLHYFSGESGSISVDTFERAFTLVQWHMGEYRRMFSDQCAIPQDQLDAHTLAIFLRQYIWRGVGSQSFIAKNLLLQKGPAETRTRHRLDAALHILNLQGAIWINVAVKNKQKFVALNDNYFVAM